MSNHATDLLAIALRPFASAAQHADRRAVAFCVVPSGGVFESGLAHIDNVSLLTLSAEGPKSGTMFVLRKSDLRYDPRSGVICRGDRVRGWDLTSERDLRSFPADQSMVLAVHGLMEALLDGAADAAVTPATVVEPWAVVPVGNEIEAARQELRWFCRNGGLAAPLGEVLAASDKAAPSGRKFIHVATQPLAGRTTLAHFRALRAAGLVAGPKKHGMWTGGVDDAAHMTWLADVVAPSLGDAGKGDEILGRLREQLGPLAGALLTDAIVREKDWQHVFDDVRVPLAVGPRLPRCRVAAAAGLYEAPGVRLEFPELCRPTREEARPARAARPAVDPLTEVRFEAFAPASGD